MEPKSPLLWHQGQFLQPQHFQQLGSYTAFMFEPYQNYITPDFWGAAELSVAETSLSNKFFELSQVKILFPDSSWVVFPGNAELAPRSFSDGWTESDKPLNVYLGLKRVNRTGENVTISDEPADVTTRFVAKEDPDEMQDMFMNGPSGQVKTMKYVLRIFWESELKDNEDYMLVQVAKLYREGETIRLSKESLPPMLTISASESLLWMVRDLRDQIASRCRQLDDYKNSGDMSGGEDSNWLKYLLALRSLNRYLPALANIIDKPVMHPYQLYGMLKQMMGEFSTFTGRVNSLGETYEGNQLLSKYDHAQPEKAFKDIFLLLSEVLNSIIIGPEHILRLNREDGFFTGDIPPEALDSRNDFYIVVRTQGEPERVTDSVTNVAKVSSRENVTLLITRALPGVPVDHCPVPPAGLPRRPHSHYFKINRNDSKWGDVQVNRNISIFWDNAPEDTVAELMILKR